VTVEQVVVPLADLVTLPHLDVTPEQAEAEFVRTGFSSFPVASAEGHLFGYVHLKDFLELSEGVRTRPIDVNVIRPLAPSRRTPHWRPAHGHAGGGTLLRVVVDGGETFGAAMLEDVVELPDRRGQGRGSRRPAAEAVTRSRSREVAQVPFRTGRKRRLVGSTPSEVLPAGAVEALRASSRISAPGRAASTGSAWAMITLPAPPGRSRSSRWASRARMESKDRADSAVEQVEAGGVEAGQHDVDDTTRRGCGRAVPRPRPASRSR
jgi:hypothetical protein